MITIPEATEKILKRSRYLAEAMSKDLINISSLARYIKPEVEGMTFKKVSNSAIIMALKRVQINLETPSSFQNILTREQEITIKSNFNNKSVSSISISLEPQHEDTPGVIYFFLKSLAWERINILQVSVMDNQLNIIVSDKDAIRTVGVLKSLIIESNE